jgi:hypothetical protein
MRAVLLLSCLLVAANASAQSAFVQGGMQREIARFSGDPAEKVYDGSPSGVSVGGAGFLAPRWTAGVEVDLGGETSTSQTTSVTIAGRLTPITTTYALRRRSASALVGYQTSHQRVTLGIYGGLSFSVVRRVVTSDAPGIVLTDPAPPAIFEDRTSGAIVGVDVAIEVAPHVFVVPGLRAQPITLGNDLAGHSIRPGVNVRIGF